MAAPGRAADMLLPVEPHQAEEWETVVETATAVDTAAPPESGTVAAAVVVPAMAPAHVMAIPAVHMATSGGGAKRNKARDLLRMQNQLWGIPAGGIR